MGRQIESAWSHPSAKFTPARELLGATITRLDRRGKYLIAGLAPDKAGEEAELIVHLGMTGQLLFGEPLDDPYVRARWELDDGHHLTFRDVRRFGRLRVVPAGEYSSIPTLAAMGPEPFGPGFDGDEFYLALKASSRVLKTQLLSQRPVAGVGNIYADEALWLAQIHPAVRKLSRPRAHLLRDAIEEVMVASLKNGGTTLRDYVTPTGDQGANQFFLRCYGRGGEPCERCGDVLRRATYDARTTTFCAQCQKR